MWSCVYILCRDSCQRGWRLLYILAAFHRCSDVMKPFLLKFLQDACESPGMQYQGRQSTHPFINPSYQSDCILSQHWSVALNRHRYCQGVWAESEEDFSIWRTHTVSKQHGTQSYAGKSLIQPCRLLICGKICTKQTRKPQDKWLKELIM